jgi:hypothetical protein
MSNTERWGYPKEPYKPYDPADGARRAAEWEKGLATINSPRATTRRSSSSIQPIRLWQPVSGPDPKSSPKKKRGRR